MPLANSASSKQQIPKSAMTIAFCAKCRSCPTGWQFVKGRADITSKSGWKCGARTFLSTFLSDIPVPDGFDLLRLARVYLGFIKNVAGGKLPPGEVVSWGGTSRPIVPRPVKYGSDSHSCERPTSVPHRPNRPKKPPKVQCPKSDETLDFGPLGRWT